MKTKMKKVFGILLSLAMVLGLLPGMSVMAIADGPHHIYNEISAIIPGLSITKNGTTVTDASSGDTITLTISGQPVTGDIGTLFLETDNSIKSRNIMVDGLQAYNANGTTITTNSTGSQTWSFTMPDDDVYVAFPPLTEGKTISINAGEAAFRTGFANLNSYCFYTDKTSSDGDSFGYLAYKDSNGIYKYTSNDDKQGNRNFYIPGISVTSLAIKNSTFYHLGFAEYYSDRSGTFTIPAISSSMKIPFSSQVVKPQKVTAENIEMSFGEICTIAATTDGDGTLSYKVVDGDDVIDVNYSTGVITTKKTGTARVKITASGTTAYAVGETTINVTVNKARAIAATVNENSRTYDGTEKPLVTVDNSTLVGGTMQYALGTDSTTEPTSGWDEGIPAGTDVGTYYVWYKAVGDTDYIDSNAECVPVEILELVSLTVTYKVINGTWSDGSTTDKTEPVQSGSKPASVPTGMKAASGYTGGAWDTDPADATITEATTFTYTFEALPTYTVTYKVVGGTWSDGSTTDKTEPVQSGSKPASVPTGMIASSGYTGGAWDTNPAEATITEATTFTYTFEALPTYTVTYKVVNGTWSDGSTTDKTETVQSGSKPASVPTGMIASSGYTGGAWDTNPTEATITEAATFTYTFTVIPIYTVTVTNDGHGTGSAAPVSGAEGTEVTLTATPAEGYAFKEWQVVSGGVTVKDNKFTIGTANVEIKAVFEEIPATVYTFTEGTGAEWTKGTQTGQNFTITGTPDTGIFDKFTGLASDGSAVSVKNYTASSGSVKLTLKAEWLETLAAGKHTLTANFTDGKAETSFTVKDAPPAPTPTPKPKKVPRTGDGAPLGLWIGLIAVGLIGLETFIAMKRRTQKK